MERANFGPSVNVAKVSRNIKASLDDSDSVMIRQMGTSGNGHGSQISFTMS